MHVLLPQLLVIPGQLLRVTLGDGSLSLAPQRLFTEPVPLTLHLHKFPRAVQRL